MKKLLVVAGFVVCCSSWAMEFRRGTQLPVHYMKLVHHCAVNVNESKTDDSFLYQEVDLLRPKCVEGENFVICSFPKENLIEFSSKEVADSLISQFYNKEIVVTGYGKGGEFAADVAEVLNKNLTGVNQVKLISFCGSESRADLDDMSLTCRLNFSHAYSLISYNSPMLETRISWGSEIRSRLSKKNIGLGIVGLGQLVTSLCILNFTLGLNADENKKNLLKLYTEVLAFCASGAICLYKSCVSFFKTPKYLPIDGVIKAFERLKLGAESAIDERELREIAQNSFCLYPL